MIFVPGASASSVAMVTIDPLDLANAQERDAEAAQAMPVAAPTTQR
jgi:hypothetical protein